MQQGEARKLWGRPEATASDESAGVGQRPSAPQRSASSASKRGKNIKYSDYFFLSFFSPNSGYPLFSPIFSHTFSLIGKVSAFEAASYWFKSIKV